MASEKQTALTNQYITQGIDPALAAQMAAASMLGTELDLGEGDIDRHGEGYGLTTPGEYGVFVGDPLGAGIGGYAAGRARGERPGILRQGKEASNAIAQEMIRQANASKAPQQRSQALRGQGPAAMTMGAQEPRNPMDLATPIPAPAARPPVGVSPQPRPMPEGVPATAGQMPVMPQQGQMPPGSENWTPQMLAQWSKANATSTRY